MSNLPFQEILIGDTKAIVVNDPLLARTFVEMTGHRWIEEFGLRLTGGQGVFIQPWAAGDSVSVYVVTYENGRTTRMLAYLMKDLGLDDPDVKTVMESIVKANSNVGTPIKVYSNGNCEFHILENIL